MASDTNTSALRQMRRLRKPVHDLPKKERLLPALGHRGRPTKDELIERERLIEELGYISRTSPTKNSKVKKRAAAKKAVKAVKVEPEVPVIANSNGNGNGQVTGQDEPVVVVAIFPGRAQSAETIADVTRAALREALADARARS